jgi:hypothetical protein
MDITPNRRHVRTVLEVLGVGRGIVTNVLRRSTAQKRVIDARVVCRMKVDNALVNTLCLYEVEG